MQEARFPAIGELFVGRYRVERVIGTGGFSRVYRARQEDLGRMVAIKVLQPAGVDGLDDEERAAKFSKVARRFEREAKLISRLKDRNTVVMYDFGQTSDGLLYMVLEYVDGITVGELLNGTGPLAPERVVKVLKQALSSLHEAHAINVLHRDIKPGNIMVYEHVGRADQVKVLDFGIAKTVEMHSEEPAGNLTASADVTADGVLVGTPRYMSPEQIRGKKLTAASDIYSLGLVAYEMLIGTKAVAADSSLQIVARHLDTEPIALPATLQLPSRLREIVNRMLLKDPSARYATCEEVLRDLEDWHTDSQVAARDDRTIDGMAVPDESLSMTAPRAPAHQYLVGAIGALVLVVMVMLGFQVMAPPGESSEVVEPELKELDEPAEAVEEIATVESAEGALVATEDSPASPPTEPVEELDRSPTPAKADEADGNDENDENDGIGADEADRAAKIRQETEKAMAADRLESRSNRPAPQPKPRRQKPQTKPKKPILKPFALDE